MSTLFVFVCEGADVEAQWLPDRNYTEGPGFRAGNVEIHPGVAVRAGYDSNIFRLPDPSPTYARGYSRGTAAIAVTPHLNIQTLSPQRQRGGEDSGESDVQRLPPPIAFNLGAAGTIWWFGNDNVQPNFEVDTEAGVQILPERIVGADVTIDYVRNIRPFGPYQGGASNTFAEDRVRPGLTLRGQSRSGVLRAALRYQPFIDNFENSRFQFLNSVSHTITGSASWRFFPNTSLIYEGNVYLTDYTKYDDALNGSGSGTIGGPTIRLSDNKRFDSRLGITGAITKMLAVRALVGYAAGHFDDRLFDSYEDVVGEAGLSLESGQSKFGVGYNRSVDFSNLGGWTRLNRGHINGGTLLGQMLAVTVEAGVARADYGRLLTPAGQDLGVDRDTNAATSKRKDLRVDAGLHMELRLTNWLALLGDVSVLRNFTDFQFAAQPAPFWADFVVYQAYGGVRAHY